ncbi:MAG: hypothetical protein AAF591_05755, partial [Verrucomicrobiota bacterium]
AERRSELEEKRVAAREKYLLRDRSYEQLMEEVAVALRSNDTLGLRVSFDSPMGGGGLEAVGE